jgi:hypothetical protein
MSRKPTHILDSERPSYLRRPSEAPTYLFPRGLGSASEADYRARLTGRGPDLMTVLC